MNHDDQNKMAMEIWEARSNKQWPALEHLIRKLLESEPKPYTPLSAGTFEVLGESLEKQGRYEGAIEAYENALNLNTSASRQGRITLMPFKRLDILYRRIGRYEDCLRICKDYTQQHQASEDAWKRLQRIAKKLDVPELVELSKMKLNPPKGNVPLGKALPRVTDKDVIITRKDIERAMESAQKHGSPAFIAMLNAKSTDDNDSKQ